MAAKLKILLVSSEVVPFAKTGGLADVAGSLPLALEKLGVDVRVAMPKYSRIKIEEDAATMDGKVKVYFIKNDKYFDRPELYGSKGGDYSDNLERFAFFSKEVLVRIKREGFKPDVIHCNDWQSALIPAYLKTIYKDDPFFDNTRVLFTINNMAYQGIFPKEEFPKTGLDWSYFDINYLEYYDKVNLMKAGLVFADIISTVSPTYAKEIQTKEFGCGLEGLIRSRRNALVGIMNGIDYDIWNPARDKSIFKNYTEKSLLGKEVNKVGLQREVGLKGDRDIPFIGIVTRLAGQKGMDLLADIIDDILRLKVQFILLGTGEDKYHGLFQKISRKHKKKVSVNLKFDAVLANKIYAASDMFLIPSRYEPCGLGQMISFKYGTIPVVRQTGGLRDSVREFDSKTGKGDGFTFKEYESKKFLSAIKKAIGVYKKKSLWTKLVRKVMRYYFSWTRSAREYMNLYNRMLKK